MDSNAGGSNHGVRVNDIHWRLAPICTLRPAPPRSNIPHCAAGWRLLCSSDAQVIGLCSYRTDRARWPFRFAAPWQKVPRRAKRDVQPPVSLRWSEDNSRLSLIRLPSWQRLVSAAPRVNFAPSKCCSRWCRGRNRILYPEGPRARHRGFKPGLIGEPLEPPPASRNTLVILGIRVPRGR